jgi:hypothetical protein
MKHFKDEARLAKCRIKTVSIYKQIARAIYNEIIGYDTEYKLNYCKDDLQFGGFYISFDLLILANYDNESQSYPEIKYIHLMRELNDDEDDAIIMIGMELMKVDDFLYEYLCEGVQEAIEEIEFKNEI